MSGSWISRRTFLRVGATAGGGLLLGVSLPFWPEGASSQSRAGFRPGAFVRLDPDGTTTVFRSKSEMGQGVTTSLAMLVAEELDVEWSSVRVEQAELDEDRYGAQATGGSSTVRLMWMPLRRAGAAARLMLRSAAADRWGVPADECTTRDGRVHHAATDRSLPYAELLAEAARQPVPEDPPLKPPSELELVGRPHGPIQAPEVSTGQAVFGLDVRIPDLRRAAVLRPPREGESLVSFDAREAEKVPGVEGVVEIPPVGAPFHVRGGVAVIARDTWSAFRGKEALEARWSSGSEPPESTERLREALHAQTEGSGLVISDRGDVDEALSGSGTRVRATYEVPFLAHAQMEPMNCTARVVGDRCELWTPAQFPGWARDGAARALGIPPERVTVHVTRLGGGFGRRINPDFSVEAALVARAAGVPVQVVWSREDDLRHGFYRPMVVHDLEGLLDPHGRPVAIHHRVAGTPLGPMYGDPQGAARFQGETGGAAHIPYRCPNHRCEASGVETPIRRGWWRSVSHNHTAFAVESFVNEMAAAAGRDPVEYRLELIDGSSPMPLNPLEAQGEEHEFDPGRLRRVLRLAGDRAEWGRNPGEGRGRGVACWWCMGTYVAEVVEAEVTGNGEIIVHRVTAAVDCGTVVNPDGARAQVEGSVIDALSAASLQEVTVADGRVQEDNFDTYPISRIDQAPRRIEVHFVPSRRPPSGLGEPGVPPAAPALAAAIHQVTGRWIRRLPFRRGLR